MERGTDLQDFKILDMQIVYVFLCIGTPRMVLFQGGGDCNTPDLTPFALKVHDIYIVINHGEELKEKSPPSIWLCYVSDWNGH